MPRPDKPINSRGRLDDPVNPSRAVRWTKHGGPETAGGYRGSPSSLEVDGEDITIVETEPVTHQPSKWEQRATSAHIPAMDTTPAVEPQTEWVVVRNVEGRTYRRTDALTVVEVSAED